MTGGARNALVVAGALAVAGLYALGLFAFDRWLQPKQKSFSDKMTRAMVKGINSHLCDKNHDPAGCRAKVEHNFERCADEVGLGTGKVDHPRLERCLSMPILEGEEAWCWSSAISPDLRLVELPPPTELPAVTQGEALAALAASSPAKMWLAFSQQLERVRLARRGDQQVIALSLEPETHQRVLQASRQPGEHRFAVIAGARAARVELRPSLEGSKWTLVIPVQGWQPGDVCAPGAAAASANGAGPASR